MPAPSLSVGRPRVVAPAGYLSMRDAATQRGVTYSVVHRHVSQKLIRSLRLDSGAIVVDVRDLERISKHEAPEDRTRVAVQLKPNAKRYKAWAKLAREHQITVTELAGALLDQASGYKARE